MAMVGNTGRGLRYCCRGPRELDESVAVVMVKSTCHLGAIYEVELTDVSNGDLWEVKMENNEFGGKII